MLIQERHYLPLDQLFHGPLFRPELLLRRMGMEKKDEDGQPDYTPYDPGCDRMIRLPLENSLGEVHVR